MKQKSILDLQAEASYNDCINTKLNLQVKLGKQNQMIASNLY